jgi:hypothetical protein
LFADERGQPGPLRNLSAQVPTGSAEMIAAAIRTIFAQRDAEHVREQLDTIAAMLGRQLPTTSERVFFCGEMHRQGFEHIGVCLSRTAVWRYHYWIA